MITTILKAEVLIQDKEKKSAGLGLFLIASENGIEKCRFPIDTKIVEEEEFIEALSAEGTEIAEAYFRTWVNTLNLVQLNTIDRINKETETINSKL